MKIATFNANSVRARLEIVLDWLAQHQPDVLAIQETKCQDHDFPAEAFQESGYNVCFHGMKSYNGVAIASKSTVRDIRLGFGDPAMPEDCRIIHGIIDGVYVINTYVPNGTRVGSDKFEYKLRWLERFRRLCDEVIGAGTPAIWLGDINIAPTPDDVFDSPKHLGGVCHHPEEFSRLAKIVEWGWTDVFREFTQGPGHYTYWEFVIPNCFARNLGWRIDHIYASPALKAKAKSCVIDPEPRAMEKPSDHTFVIAEFDL